MTEMREGGKNGNGDATRILENLFRRDGTPSMFNIMASALNIL